MQFTKETARSLLKTTFSRNTGRLAVPLTFFRRRFFHHVRPNIEAAVSQRFFAYLLTGIVMSRVEKLNIQIPGIADKKAFSVANTKIV